MQQRRAGCNPLPGAGEATELVTFPPRFSWKPYAGAKSYEVRMFDSRGGEVWQNLAVAADARNSAGDVEAKDDADNPISSTEELRGLFSVR